MEYIPQIRLTADGLRVVGPSERQAAHSVCPADHPTTQVLLLDSEGRLLVVDKYPKNLRKAQIYQYAPPAPAVRLDCFGGHIQFEQLTDREQAGFLTYSTYLAGALEELREECGIRQADGTTAPFPADPQRMEYLSFARIQDGNNAEYSASFLYRTDLQMPFTGRDDIVTPDGEREQIPLPLHRFAPAALLALFRARDAQNNVWSDGALFHFCTGLAGALSDPAVVQALTGGVPRPGREAFPADVARLFSRT